MKFKIEADVTPQEARDFLGLPDVRHLQERWLAEVEELLMSDVANFSPERFLQYWMTGASANAELMTKLFESFGRLGRERRPDE